MFIASSAEEIFKMEKKSEYTKITSTTPIELQASIPREKKKNGNQFFSSLLTKCAMIFRTVEDKKRDVLLTKK